MKISEDFLLREYKEKKRYKTDIARECNCTVATIDHYLKKFNINYNKRHSVHFKDISNQKFNRWYVTELNIRDKFNKVKWLCICDCGNKKYVNSASLIKGISISCGCYKHEKLSKGFKGINGAYWNKLHKSSLERKIEFNLDIKDAWNQFVKQQGKCALSGIPIILVSNNDKFINQTASLDRIDSNNGYIKNNIQWVFKRINLMKGNLTDNQFISLCRYISDYNKQYSILSLEELNKITYNTRMINEDY